MGRAKITFVDDKEEEYEGYEVIENMQCFRVNEIDEKKIWHEVHIPWHRVKKVFVIEK